jgi:DNA-binding NarL/FixJ family response regulator
MAAKVLLVDDHVLVRQGIRRLLAETEGLEIAGEAGDGLEAVRKARELKPDLILMDLFLPQLGGVEATRIIKREQPEIGVILLTASDAEDDIYQAVTAGAKGYVVKTTDYVELVRQIQQAMAGEVAISAAVMSKLAASLSRRGESGLSGGTASHEHLTDREKEVLVHVGHGARNREIAASLSISNNTVRAHVRSIMHKLDVDNRAQLAAYAVRLGLVQGDLHPTQASGRKY